MNRITCIGIALTLGSMAHADMALKHFGWLNADYGYSTDLYADSNGSDQLGAAQLALGTKATLDNVSLIGVIGADAMSNGGSQTGDHIRIRDAFIDWDKIGGTGLGASFGAQPFLFGLKASGYPGDRSIRPGIEFGGAGAVAVSRQAGPSVKLRYNAMDKATFTVGAFDNSGNNRVGAVTPGYGSGIVDNQFADLSFHDLGVAGAYGFVGFERAYVGGSVDESKPLFDGGLGYKQAFFDLSAEFIFLDPDFAGTADTENYLVAELTVMPVSKLSVYADYARADQLEAQTVRAGVTYQSHDILAWTLEYSMDGRKAAAGGDAQGVNARAHVGF